MKEVYIVTQGNYSDYHIVAVFETENEAAAFVGPYTNDYDIEKWDLGGERTTPVGKAAYYVKMYRDGVVAGVQKSVDNEDDAQKGTTYVFDKDFMSSLRQETNMITYMFARDEEHAIKIANERRAYLIATDQWKDGTYTDVIAAAALAAEANEP